MAVSKVTLNGETLMDVTGVTVDTDNLLYGETALKNSGASITGAVVTAAASDTAPAMDGTASAGSSSTYSRGDHVHPTDTSRQATITASGILKGNGSGTVTAAVAGTDYAAASHNQALSTITGADDLKAIEALTGTSGLLKKTAANTWSLDTSSYLTSESDPVFTASAAHGISSTDISNWNDKAEVSDIPTDVSELNNDAGYITGYTETDPTVPSWAKASSKPTYTASEVGASASDHVHGNITNGGDITTTATIASGDRLVINDESASKVTNSSITFGSSTTTFLTNKGTWATPSGAVTSVNGATGAVMLDAEDVGALPDDTTIPQGTVTSVRVQATSPVQSSTSTAQTATLNTTISLADGYGDTKNPYASKTKNTVLAAPSTANGTPSFRALVAADIPTLTKSKISDFPTAVSSFTNDAGYITGYTETDPTVPSWAKAASKPTYTASEVGALPDTTTIPSATSDLTNDSGFITANDVPVEVFIVEKEVTTFASILAAHNANQLCILIDGAQIYRMVYLSSSSSAVFTRSANSGGYPFLKIVSVDTTDTWAEETLTSQTKITASGLLKGDGAGGITAATAGTDYAAASHNHNVEGLNNFGTRVYDATASRTANTFLAAPNGSAGAGTFRAIAAADLPNATTSAKGAVIAGSGLTMSTATLNHASSITAATAGTSSATSGATLAVPYITYNATGHITAAGTHTHTISGLGVSAGGTGATTFTSGYALIGNGTSAITTRAITNNTATSTALTANTNLITANTLRYHTNRTTSVAAADTNYTTYMARGEALNSTDTNPTANGCISWTYS